LFFLFLSVNGTGAVCDQKTSKFFVSAGKKPLWDTWDKWSVVKVRENTNGCPGGSWTLRKHVSALQVLLKPMIT
jgi:hypothetical protein